MKTMTPSRRRELLNEAKEKYRTMWLEGTKRGYPMELLGFPREAELLAIGAGAPTGIPGMPLFPVPNLLTPREVGVSNEELKIAEEKAENIEQTINRIEEAKQQFDEAKHSHGADDTAYEDPPNEIPRSSAGGGGSRRSPIRGRPPPRIIRETLNPYHHLTDEGKQYARDNPTADVGTIRALTASISSDSSLSIHTGGSSDVITKAFNRNKKMQEAVLRVLNDAGVEIGSDKSTPAKIKRLKKEIVERDGISIALLWNQILETMQEHTTNETIQRMTPVPTDNLTVARVGANLKPIDEETQQSISYAILREGVPNVVADRTARRIVSRVKALTKELEGKFGSKDIALDMANDYIKQVMEEIVDSLHEDRQTSRINSHILLFFLLSLKQKH